MTSLLLIALLTIAAAALAMCLRNLVRSVLLLTLAWMGIAIFYLWAGAEFAAFGQVLVYVGAISMVVLFAVLLTRHTRNEADFDWKHEAFGRALAGTAIAGVVAGVLAGVVLSSELPALRAEAPQLTVREIGRELMGAHAAALLVVGLILTVALIGAVVIAAGARGSGLVKKEE